MLNLIVKINKPLNAFKKVSYHTFAQRSQSSATIKGFLVRPHKLVPTFLQMNCYDSESYDRFFRIHRKLRRQIKNQIHLDLRQKTLKYNNVRVKLPSMCNKLKFISLCSPFDFFNFFDTRIVEKRYSDIFFDMCMILLMGCKPELFWSCVSRRRKSIVVLWFLLWLLSYLLLFHE